MNSADPIRKPAGEESERKTGLSDDFSGDELGFQWQFFKDLTWTEFPWEMGY